LERVYESGQGLRLGRSSRDLSKIVRHGRGDDVVAPLYRVREVRLTGRKVYVIRVSCGGAGHHHDDFSGSRGCSTEYQWAVLVLRTKLDDRSRWACHRSP